MSRFTLSISFFKPSKYEIFSDCINELSELVYDYIGYENSPSIEFNIKDLEKEHKKIELKIDTKSELFFYSFRIFSTLINDRYKDSISIKKISLIYSTMLLFKKKVVLVKNKLVDSCKWCGEKFDYEKGYLDYCNKSCNKNHTKNHYFLYQESEVI